MIANDICKALCALPGDGVELRHRPITTPITIMVIGIVLLIINIVAIDDKSSALSMLLLIAGISMLGYGGITTIMRRTNDQLVPYLTSTKRYMDYRERYYDRSQLDTLQLYLAVGDESKLEEIPTSNISAIVLAEYRANDNSIVAYALYEYVDFDYRLIGDVKIIL